MPRLEINYILTPLSPSAKALPEKSRGRLFCGAGVGRGGIDRVAIRGADGMPYIPGSTAKGVIREKCLELCRAIGLQPTRRRDPANRPTHLHELPVINGIFGAPAQSALHSVFTDLKLKTPESIAQVMKRVQMSRRLGRPANQRLFDVEYTLCGPLHGSIMLWRDRPPEEDPGVALLLGGLKLLHALGGHRSTGAGLYQTKLEEGRWGRETVTQERWKESLQLLGSTDIQERLKEEASR